MSENNEQNTEQNADDSVNQIVTAPVEPAPVETMKFVRNDVSKYPGGVVYKLRESIEILTNFGVISEELQNIYVHCGNYINQLTKKYIVNNPESSLDFQNYIDKLKLIANKFGDKNPDGTPIISNENSIVVSDPKNLEICNEAILFIKNEYKDVISLINTYNKVMEYVKYTYLLTNEEYDYIISKEENLSTMMFQFPDFDEVKEFLHV